ncbi:MAG: dTDP-4-dehydrorhamnose 3,5-epimerase [Bacillales bacterium]|jgi:dTDP-4-dehydrorhamnose reductase|nr:dTDP-4-dehydrorhamnose 3,5-epimerase [Bacillales bacterium]
MKVLVTGVSGQLGYDVVYEGEKRGLEMIGSDVVGETAFKIDITDKELVLETVRSLQPDVIIHCAAFTAVDKAEEMKDVCWKVNVNGTENLVLAAKEVGAKFVYISTDYVFDGRGVEAFVETHQPSPVGFYGLTKYEGEKVVQTHLDNYFIIRISWVFGLNGLNFVKTMLKLAETRDVLNVVGDQIGSPTYTHDLSRLIIDMVETEKYGIYHATNEGFCSWADFAKEIFKISGKEVKVNTVTSVEYPTIAVRPKNSRLSKQKIAELGFEPLRSWKEALTHYLKELKQQEVQ